LHQITTNLLKVWASARCAGFDDSWKCGEPLIRFDSPFGFDPAKVFFALPLVQAREISARVAFEVVRQATGGRELLDEGGHKGLRDALARELPKRSTNDLFLLAAEVAATAHMLATVEWRNAGHRPGDTPAVGLSTLEGGLLIHLHALPESVPARALLAIWKEYAALNKHRFMRPPHPTNEAMGRWARLNRELDQPIYEYWHELRAQP